MTSYTSVSNARTARPIRKHKGIAKRYGLWLLACIALIGIYGYIRINHTKAGAEQLRERYVISAVDTGEVTVAVSADGTISAADTANVIIPAAGKLKKLVPKEGDHVFQGDVLGVIVKNTEYIEREVEQLENALAQQEQQQKSAQSAYSDRVIKSPVDGRVKDVRAKVGEDASVTVNTFGFLALISPNGKMEVQLGTIGPAPAIGASVDMMLDGTGEKLKGKVIQAPVSAAIDASLASDTDAQAKGAGGMIVVEIARDDLPVGAPVTVSLPGAAKIGTGSLAIQNPVMVQGSGPISSIKKGENDRVSRGDTLFTINSSDITRSVAAQQLQIDQIHKQLEERRKQLLTAEETIVAPCSGIVTQLAGKEGFELGGNHQLAVIIADNSMEAVVSVDELDILKLQEGQSVSVQADALPGQPFPGTVKRIAQIGNVGSGRTTFDVTISLTPPEQLRIGMNINVGIDIERTGLVQRIPVSAIRETREGQAVLLASLLDDPEAIPRRGSDEIPQQVLSRHLRRVEVGLVNEDYAQVLSGLEEGDRVLIDAATTNLMDMFIIGQEFRPVQLASAIPAGELIACAR